MSIRGRKILITRDENSDNEFAKILSEVGAETIFFPTISINDVEDHKDMDKVLSELSKYDGLLFTSVNAVKYFFERAEMFNVKYTGKIYSVGEKTKDKVESYGYDNSFIPGVYSAEGLIRSLPKDEIEGKSFLFPRGNISMKTLQDGLAKYAKVDEVEVYHNTLPNIDTEKGEHAISMIKNGEIDCISFFSPSSIKNFILLIPGFQQRDTKIAVIGETTRITANEYGLKVEIIPAESTSRSMADAVIKYYNNK
jgi:uroporphyrinogen-III synthase